MKLLSVIILAMAAVAWSGYATLTLQQCKRRTRFWRTNCLKMGWKTDIESCKPEMSNELLEILDAKKIKRRTNKCTRIEGELKTTGGDCWPVDCTEELEPTLPPTEEALDCKELQSSFVNNKCSDVICSGKDDNTDCSVTLSTLQESCSFAFDCPEPTPIPQPEVGKLGEKNLVMRRPNEAKCRKICAGKTSLEGTEWKQYYSGGNVASDGAYIDIDISDCDFVDSNVLPDIGVTVSAESGSRQMYNIGGSAVSRSEKAGFIRVYVLFSPNEQKDKKVKGIDPSKNKPTDTLIMVKDNKWRIEWVATGLTC